MPKINTAPRGFTGYIRSISTYPSGLQEIIVGKGSSPSKKDRKFYIENYGVRQMHNELGRNGLNGTKIKVYTGKESWEKNLITRFNVIE